MKLGCLPLVVNLTSGDSDGNVSYLPPHGAVVKFKFFHKFYRLNLIADFEFNVDSAAATGGDDYVRSGSSWGSLRKWLLDRRSARRAAPWRRDALGLVLGKQLRSSLWGRSEHRSAFF
jgi:hypothetical protein